MSFVGVVVPAEGPLRRETFKDLTAVQRAVGGYIEAVASPSLPNVYGYVNEEGGPQGLPPNPRASLHFRVPLVGDVVMFAATPNGREVDAPEGLELAV